MKNLTKNQRRDQMAISPLDLQTLFTQADKVGKQDAAQRDGAALFQSIQQSKIQQQSDDRIRAVNEAQDMGEGTEAINDKKGGGGTEGHSHPGEETEEKNEENNNVIQDPYLGRNLDLNI